MFNKIMIVVDLALMAYWGVALILFLTGQLTPTKFTIATAMFLSVAYFLVLAIDRASEVLSND